MEKTLNSEACRIIDALGGPSATSRIFGIAPASVTEWKTNGVPAARLMYLRLAKPELFGAAIRRRSKPLPSDEEAA